MKYIIEDEVNTEKVAKLSLVKESGRVKLAVYDEIEDHWWIIVSLTEAGKLERHVNVPSRLGFKMDGTRVAEDV